MARDNPSAINRPLFREIETAAAGAGVEATYTFPNDKFIRILSVKVILVTDGTVLNRSVSLALGSAFVGGLYRIPAPMLQAATLTYSYNWLAGMSFNNAAISNNRFVCGFPHEMIRSPASTIATDTLNLQAGDNITNFGLTWLEWQSLT